MPNVKSPAVLFDIDGTLVDSNYVHVYAWVRAFHDVGAEVDGWRIHRGMGMDGSKLLESLLGSSTSGQAEEAKELHTMYYRESAVLLRVFAGARDLLHRTEDAGLQVVLATSAPEDELEILRDLLDVEKILSIVTSAEDAETAKPEPDIVQAALESAGVSADRAVMLGDSVWDMEAAGRAGVKAVGVLTGGVSRSELIDSGCIAVYDDAKKLAEGFDESPLGQLQNALRARE